MRDIMTKLDLFKKVCIKCGNNDPAVKWFNAMDQIPVQNTYFKYETEQFLFRCRTCGYYWNEKVK